MTDAQQVLAAITRTVIGLVCFLVGLGCSVYQIEHPPISRGVVYVFIGVALFGALLLPSIWDVTYPRVVKLAAFLPWGQKKDGGCP